MSSALERTDNPGLFLLLANQNHVASGVAANDTELLAIKGQWKSLKFPDAGRLELHANELYTTILRTTFLCRVTRGRTRLAIPF
jgi:hypothetical protein